MTTGPGPEARAKVTACPQQSREGGTALWGGFAVDRVPTSLEENERKLMMKDIWCSKLGKFRKAREMAIVFLSVYTFSLW